MLGDVVTRLEILQAKVYSSLAEQANGTLRNGATSVDKLLSGRQRPSPVRGGVRPPRRDRCPRSRRMEPRPARLAIEQHLQRHERDPAQCRGPATPGPGHVTSVAENKVDGEAVAGALDADARPRARPRRPARGRAPQRAAHAPPPASGRARSAGGRARGRVLGTRPLAGRDRRGLRGGRPSTGPRQRARRGAAARTHAERRRARGRRRGDGLARPAAHRRAPRWRPRRRRRRPGRAPRTTASTRSSTSTACRCGWRPARSSSSSPRRPGRRCSTWPSPASSSRRRPRSIRARASRS